MTNSSDNDAEGTPSQEEPEQFAQPRDALSPFSPVIPSSLSPSLGPETPGADSSAEVEPIGAVAQESPREKSQSRPSSTQEEREGSALTDAQRAFLAEWPHDRQPTFEEVDRLMSRDRSSSPIDTDQSRERSSRLESEQARPLKRTRDDDLSDEESSDTRLSRPTQRRRLTPGAAFETRAEPSEIQADSLGNNDRPRGGSLQDGRNAGAEPVIEASAENRTGNSMVSASQSARPAETSRRRPPEPRQRQQLRSVRTVIAARSFASSNPSSALLALGPCCLSENSLVRGGALVVPPPITAILRTLL